MGAKCSCHAGAPGTCPVCHLKARQGQVAPEELLFCPQTALEEAAEDLKRSREKGPLEKHYTLSKIIGHGAYSKVYEATQISSGRQVAVKSIPKAEGEEEAATQREGVVREIAVMQRLAGHPAAMALLDLIEGPKHYHLVVELCTGGELFDQIIKRGHFSEHEGAELARALLSFIAHCHARGVVHRDVKPENIMLAEAKEGAVLKVVDYGTGAFCAPGQKLHEKLGTPYYVAPEVLQKDYGPPADVWSAGVVAYILLCGSPPFGGRSDERILAKVARGSYSFAAKEWEGVSEDAKGFVSQMLTVDPADRPSAEKLLSHPWLAADHARPGGVTGGVTNEADAAELGAHMISRLREFAGMSRMKRLALVVLARTLTDSDVSRLQDLFHAMDVEDTGTIGAEELQQALEQVGVLIDEDEMRSLLASSDMDGKGRIAYDEFIAAMMDSSRVARRKHNVRRSFQQLDRDGDGLISVQDLAEVLQEVPINGGTRYKGRARSLDMAASIVSEVDCARKGALTYEDFERVWAST